MGKYKKNMPQIFLRLFKKKKKHRKNNLSYELEKKIQKSKVILFVLKVSLIFFAKFQPQVLKLCPN